MPLHYHLVFVCICISVFVCICISVSVCICLCLLIDLCRIQQCTTRATRLITTSLAKYAPIKKKIKKNKKKIYYHLILCEMATIHQFDNNPEEDEFYLVEIYWFITYTLVEPSINQQFIHANTTRLL